MGIRLLRLNVEGLVVIFGVDDSREIEALGIRSGEPGVAIGAPLHWCSDAVPVGQVDVVPHPDLVAVVDDRSARQGQQEGVHQLDSAPVIPEQRGESAPNAEIDAGLGILGVYPIHIVAVLVGHHLECELIMVAEKERPLAGVGNAGRLPKDVHNWESILSAQPHEEAGHEREIEGHVALVPISEVGGGFVGPLVGFG